MKFRMIVMLVGLLILIVTGCNREVTMDEQTAEAYVQAQGYKVLKHKGQITAYTLEKKTLESNPYQQSWSVQKHEPDPYFGKEVTVYGFTVANHPLEQIYPSKTNVSIMLCEGKVIGGNSFPENNGKMIRVGAPYSLDGKTLEEVTGMTYIEWTAYWKQKYGSN
ncbi:hypothetical protein SAMN03159341_103220 [Paenibacillus sp. 1_12]|nr:hypothetical protein SAMN03159341_103220 [Paenibacillus sp. 1_12]